MAPTLTKQRSNSASRSESGKQAKRPHSPQAFDDTETHRIIIENN